VCVIAIIVLNPYTRTKARAHIRLYLATQTSISKSTAHSVTYIQRMMSTDSMRTGSVERTSSIERTSSNIERTSSTESFDRSPSITSPDTFVMRRSGPESPARAARGSTLGSPTKQNSPLKPGSPVKHSVPVTLVLICFLVDWMDELAGACTQST